MIRNIRTDRYLDYLFIICVGLFAFSPCFFNFFVSDDFIWLKRGADFSFNHLFRSSRNPDYNIFRPLVPTLFFMLKRLFGLSPFGYHLTSILLHVSNSLLFYHILSHFSLTKNIMVLSSVVFVSHFVHEETLFWISSLSVPLCCLFYLSSVLIFLKWLKNGRVRFYFLSLSSGVIAFFIREDALSLPLILSFITVVKYFISTQAIANNANHKTRITALIAVMPFFILEILYLKLRNFGLPQLNVGSLFSLNPANFLKNAIYFSVNLGIPIRLIFDLIGYHYSAMINSTLKNVGSNLFVVMCASLGIAGLIWVLSVWIRKTNKVLRLLIVTFFVILFPYLFFKGYGLRFTYFPALGLSLIGSYLMLSVLKTVTKRTRHSLESYVYILMIVILVFNFFILFERHPWWRRASKTCEETIEKAETALLPLPVGSTVYFTNLPLRLHGAYVFNNGFPEAMSLFYPLYTHEIKTIESGRLPLLKVEELKNCYLFKYENREFHRVFWQCPICIPSLAGYVA